MEWNWNKMIPLFSTDATSQQKYSLPLEDNICYFLDDIFFSLLSPQCECCIPLCLLTVQHRLYTWYILFLDSTFLNIILILSSLSLKHMEIFNTVLLSKVFFLFYFVSSYYRTDSSQNIRPLKQINFLWRIWIIKWSQ